MNENEPRKFRMPEWLKPYLKVEGDRRSLPVELHLAWFREENPDCTITTEVLTGSDMRHSVVVKATIQNGKGEIIATGHSHKATVPVGPKVDLLEEAESGAIERALAFAGFGPEFWEIS